MKVTFIGDPAHGGDGPESFEMFVHHFEKGKPTEVDGRTAQAKKFENNNHFKCEASTPAKKTKAKT